MTRILRERQCQEPRSGPDIRDDLSGGDGGECDDLVAQAKEPGGASDLLRVDDVSVPILRWREHAVPLPYVL